MGFLEDLDAKYLPGLAAWLDRQVRRLPTPPEPEGPAPFIVRLRRVDDRWARKGPLALVRDVPQLGAVVVAALVLSGAVVVRSRTHPPAEGRPGAEQTAGPAQPDSTHLGPQLGDSVTQYLRAARDRLATYAPGQPDGVAVAVISFTGYRTPQQVRDLLGPVQVKVIYYRAAPMPLNVVTLHDDPVQDLLKDSRKAFARAAAEPEARARELDQINPTIPGNTPEEARQKADQEKDAKNFHREAALLRGTCACIYGVVVRTRLRLLLDLVGRPEIRSIDPSRPGADLDDLTYQALLPEEKVTVTGGNQAG
ncbi:MAG TPA: hypothetical protein VFQ85_03960 [Mycobacteriales bacterium]|jgi:hypothetical protein|nr:hypothetical protein [Mycobacteriales bacterium]